MSAIVVSISLQDVLFLKESERCFLIDMIEHVHCIFPFHLQSPRGLLLLSRPSRPLYLKSLPGVMVFVLYLIGLYYVLLLVKY